MSRCTTNHENRIQGAEGSRIQVNGLKFETLNPIFVLNRHAPKGHHEV